MRQVAELERQLREADSQLQEAAEQLQLLAGELAEARRQKARAEGHAADVMRALQDSSDFAAQQRNDLIIEASEMRATIQALQASEVGSMLLATCAIVRAWTRQICKSHHAHFAVCSILQPVAGANAPFRGRSAAFNGSMCA